MNNNDKQYLLSIRSIFELDDNYSCLPYFLDRLSDRDIAYKISFEFCLRNYGNIISEIDNYLFCNSEANILYEKLDIQNFDFELIANVNINKIKFILGLETLPLAHAYDNEGFITDNYQYWNNEGRFLVTISKDLTEEIKLNDNLKLNVNKEIILANLGYFTNLIISKSFMYNNEGVEMDMIF